MGLFKPNWAKMNTDQAEMKIESITRQDWLVDAVWYAPMESVKYMAVRKLTDADSFLKVAENCGDFRLKCLLTAFDKIKQNPQITEALTAALINECNGSQISYKAFEYEVSLDDLINALKRLPKKNLELVALNAKNIHIIRIAIRQVTDAAIVDEFVHKHLSENWFTPDQWANMSYETLVWLACNDKCSQYLRSDACEALGHRNGSEDVLQRIAKDMNVDSEVRKSANSGLCTLLGHIPDKNNNCRCSRCGYSEILTSRGLGLHNFVNGVCTECGAIIKEERAEYWDNDDSGFTTDHGFSTNTYINYKDGSSWRVKPD